MEANYHTHTWRCKHARGTEREYVEKAIEAGFRVLGFSDHSPYPFPNDYCSGFRMSCSEAEGYFRTVSDLKREYREDITIHIGVEAEYYPLYFENLLRFLEQYPCEYMIMGQHFLYNEIDRMSVAAVTPTKAEEVLRHYAEQTAEGLGTGKFLYFAHPDICHYEGSMETYRKYSRHICEAALKFDIPLELNLLGVEDHRHYPNENFWQIAGEVGNRVIIGCDAHSPEAVYVPAAVEEAMRMVKKYGLKLEHQLNVPDKI